tara:strand:- start:191 stop:577 length:387 start_codon:yes stop_codon:yes gene_type:complete
MDKILELLGLSQLMQPKAHDNIDSLIQSNQSMPEQTIGPIPEGGLSQQALLEMIMPFGAMGKIAKTGARAGRGILEATKGMRRKGTANETFRELAKDTRLKGPKYDAGDDFFKRTIRNLFESMEGKEF